MKLRTAFLAALATLPLLAGGASAHGGWDDRGYGHDRRGPEAGYWREREARHAWHEARRAREWEWQRLQAWEQRNFAPPPPSYGPPGWGPRW